MGNWGVAGIYKCTVTHAGLLKRRVKRQATHNKTAHVGHYLLYFSNNRSFLSGWIQCQTILLLVKEVFPLNPAWNLGKIQQLFGAARFAGGYPR